ncbi:glycogen debranching N-terminal domain-containing protein [Nitriliruptor alkaliphilus]|uniref:amylo-alpha-1,6-glucosidase n=1 Tax=Nitriliruptor alkaliphilus TaxID=427918 RepID=UPI0006980440|nr:glycogen debranching N-terminal domain-containing protein [Nitriliruptor alkaliphilus]
MTDYSHVGPLGEVTTVHGEAFLVSGPDGDVSGGDQGFYVRDTRFLDRLEFLLDGVPPSPLAGRAIDAARAVFHGYAAPGEDHTIDATLLVTRRRVVDGSLHEELLLENRSSRPATVHVSLCCGSDFAYIFDVKHGRRNPRPAPIASDGQLAIHREAGVEQVVLRGTAGAVAEGDRLGWDLEIPGRREVRCCVDVEIVDVYGAARPQRRCEAFSTQAASPPTEDIPKLRCSDDRLTRLVHCSLEDLASLKLRDPLRPEDRFYAAGSPWYLTLFGRDALWAGLMSLPFDLGLVAGTLRALARRQGRRLDPDTEEAPGKILHEIRRGSLVHRGDLPPNYYGTVDATPLFVVLLHEAWSWGMPAAEVEELLPNAEAALAWMRDHGDPDGDGFLEYRKQGTRGLDNQGWKDSHDGIQFADGRLPEPPIALVEVQSYAYDAATRGAELLERFGRPGADEWRRYAAELRRRFHETFWLTDDEGPYLAVAVDGTGQTVDGVASNMGHVLLSGLLDDDQAAAVARRLVTPEAHSGWGLRTMATSAVGYNPLSYHGGSVWPHDTAIAAYGCALHGRTEEAETLLRGLVSVAPYFRSRLPELFAGTSREPADFPVPFPTACRPQAWAAAASLLLVRACLRPEARVPDGYVTFSPLWPPPFRRLELHDVPLAGGWLDITVDRDDGVTHQLRASDLEIRTLSRAGGGRR